MSEVRKSSRELRRFPQREWNYLAAVVLSATVVLLIWCGWDAVVSDRSRLCILIFALFVFGVIKSALDVRYIQTQMDLANQQLVAIEAAPGVQMFLKACLPGIFRDHVSNLFEIYRRDNLISQDNLVSLLQLKMQARTRLTRQIASTAVTLGLVGTIVGLVLAIGPMVEAFQPDSGGTQQVKEGMAKTMTSMKTAFYTTLFGAVMGGVGLRVMSSLVDSQAESLVGHIAELCEVHLIPAMRNAAKHREVVPLDELPEDIDLRKYGLQPSEE